MIRRAGHVPISVNARDRMAADAVKLEALPYSKKPEKRIRARRKTATSVNKKKGGQISEVLFLILRFSTTPNH